ncbi:MAG TPA: ferrous iron transporter B [Candidatus Gallimonas intestinavium]|uniref:Fe(2+) transporter FeoB n=1 Tax=Candidatus Gallimonas intestinavium TaxID=2838603 RepID=A0A9D2G752_9FIRM|nr:ferrous iron transporter B [Candidatus Gallimonas intestinavium]
MKKFALAGNPNCGKTTLFNLLTGSTAYVGNWPGVTVEKREGTYKKGAEPALIVDLPGIYSLSPYTPEEVISRNYILDERPDCVINIVDATNLERNLYLTTQLMEIDVPMVIALNMMDAVEKAGDKIDAAELERKIGIPVVRISALRGTGIKELMDRAIKASKTPRRGETVLEDSPVAHLVKDVSIALEGQKVVSPLFHAVKLSELDELETKAHPELVPTVNAFKATFSDNVFGGDLEAVVADARYKYISANFTSVVTKKNKKEKLTRSDRADKVLTHRVWGIPIFLVILFAVFHLTFSENFLFLNGFGEGWMPSLEDLGMDTENFWVRVLACVYDGTVFSPGCILNNLWNDIIVGELFGLIGQGIEQIPVEWVAGFLGNGVLEGIAAVLSFLPWILVLFLFFSILEDSGYMARVAFILDRIFRKFGLSGRAFMPMIMGFGCSIPATINTRTLADDNERTATIRVIPFFSCGAKLPILTAVAGAIVASFGVANADLITYAMYLLGIVTAIVCVILMRSTTMRGDVPPFIMELPAYHAPRFSSLMIHLWDKTKHFVKKAFTIILASTIIIWVISHFSPTLEFLSDERINESILANFGRLVQPLLTPVGFGAQLGEWGWVFAVAAVTGLIAKENVISTFATLAACITGAALAEDESGITYVQAMIDATGIGIPGLIAFIAFNMTTIPCFAATATARAELPKGKFGWTLLFWVATSYVVSMAVYLIGTWWWTVFLFAAVAAIVILSIVLYNKNHPVGVRTRKSGRRGARAKEAA